jgi:hypothetical protein
VDERETVLRFIKDKGFGNHTTTWRNVFVAELLRWMVNLAFSSDDVHIKRKTRLEGHVIAERQLLLHLFFRRLLEP